MDVGSAEMAAASAGLPSLLIGGGKKTSVFNDKLLNISANTE